VAAVETGAEQAFGEEATLTPQNGVSVSIVGGLWQVVHDSEADYKTLILASELNSCGNRGRAGIRGGGNTPGQEAGLNPTAPSLRTPHNLASLGAIRAQILTTGWARAVRGERTGVRIPGRMPGACVRHVFAPVFPCHVQPL